MKGCWPRACRARPSLTTCSRSIRPTTRVCGGSSHRRSRCGGSNGLEPRVREIIGGLLDALAAAGPDATVDLVPNFAYPLPYTVICELLGVPEDDRTSFSQALMALLSPTDTPEQYAHAKEGSDAVVAHLTKLVETKERLPGDDLVTALIRARDGDDSLDHGELLSTLLQLIIAGHDTTTSLVGNGVVALLRNPDQLASVKADPALLGPLVEEIMRYDAPVPHATFRYAAEDIEVGGLTIPKGGQVIISLAAANRDGARFSDAERFDVGRADNRHLAFGHGIHFCLGAPLARMEGVIALGSLLSRFPDLRLAVPPDDLHWGHGDGLVLRGLNALPVVLGPDRQVVAVHRDCGALADDHLDGVRGLLHDDVEFGAVLLRGLLQHVVRALLRARRLADTHAHADEVIGLQVLHDRLEAVVPGEATADLHPHAADGQVELVVHDHDLLRIVDAVPTDELRDGLTRQVHVRLREREHHVLARDRHLG